MPKYQLVFQLPMNAVAGFDAMVAIEDDLVERLSRIGEVDGHDIGSGTVNYFVITADPEKSFERAKPVFEQRKLLKSLKAAYARLIKDDLESDYKNIWPTNSKSEFKVIDLKAAKESVGTEASVLPPWLRYADPKNWQSEEGFAYAKNWIEKHEAVWKERVAEVPKEVRMHAPKVFVAPPEWEEFRRSIIKPRK